MTRIPKPRPMSKARRLAAAEAILSRVFDGWVPGWVQCEWIRDTPNSHARVRWKSEPMSDDEHRLLEEYR